MVRLRSVPAFTFGLGLLLAAAPAIAQDLAPANARGTLTVEYIYDSEGAAPGDAWDATWRAKRNARITAEVFAQPPNDIPVLHDQEAALSAAQGRTDRAFGVAGRVSTMMEAAEAIGERCGDDDACFEREGMRLAQESQANGQTQALMDSREDMQALTQSGDHYQYWGGNFGAGQYSIDETVELSGIDPGTGGPWTNTIVRRGGGDLPASAPGVTIPTAGPGNLTGVEFDRNSGTLALKLPVPGLTPGTETTDGETKDAFLAFPVHAPGEEKPLIVPIRGRDWRDQSGEETIRFTGDRQENGVLTIRWRFTAR